MLPSLPVGTHKLIYLSSTLAHYGVYPIIDAGDLCRVVVLFGSNSDWWIYGASLHQA